MQEEREKTVCESEPLFFSTKGTKVFSSTAFTFSFVAFTFSFVAFVFSFMTFVFQKN